ncbi:IQ calmodulin-binding motif family protein, partial [Trichomonas vaginalis G3]
MENELYDARSIWAVIRLQAIFRGKKYREKVAMMDRENACALKIQTCFRQFRQKVKILHCREIVAMRVITKFIHDYKARKLSEKQYQNLVSFDHILFYYPSASRNLKSGDLPSPKKSLRNTTEFPRPKSSKTSAKREIIAKGYAVDLKSAVKDARKQANKSKPQKRNIIIELPPPWHDENPAKISTTQKDEMLYEQKSNFAWAKSELLPRFLYICDQYLEMCDDLIARNDKYMKRIVQYPSIITIPRSSKPTFMKSAHEIVPFPEKGLYFVASLTSAAFIELENFTHDHLCHLTDIQTNAPLLDVAIQPFSGQVFGIDSRWKLHIFELGISIFERQLEVPIKIPDSRKFIFFDKIGMLWINLLSQGGNLICCDPITLTPTIQFTRETLFSVEYQLVKLLTITPLSYNNNATGFACTFVDSSDVFIFSNDFSNHRVLKHPNMKGMVRVSRFDTRIFVWSTDKIIYVYE